MPQKDPRLISVKLNKMNLIVVMIVNNSNPCHVLMKNPITKNNYV